MSLVNDVPDRAQASGRARVAFFVISSLAVVVTVAIGRAIMLPFLLAALVGYVLYPIVRRFERARAPRWAAILLVYAFTVGGTAGFFVSVVPTLFDELKSLTRDLPGLTRQLRNDILPRIDSRLRGIGRFDAPTVAPPNGSPPVAPNAPAAPIVVTPRGDGAYEIRIQEDLNLKPARDGSWTLGPPHDDAKPFSSERILRDALDRSIAHLQSHSADLIGYGRQVVGGVSRGIFYFFITLMLAAYMMMTWEDIHRFFRELCPEHRRASLDQFLVKLDRGLAGVVRGQLLICLVNGLLTAVGLWLFNLKYWPVLSIVAGVMSIIPIFGSILSSIPAVALGLTQGPGTAAGVLLWIVGIHQLEANFLNPKIIGDQAKIHPVLVVFALLLGENLFAITGALLAVPCLALVQTVFLHFRESVLDIPDPSSRTSAAGPPPLDAASSGGEAPSAAPPAPDMPKEGAGS